MPDFKLGKVEAKIQLPDGGGGYRDYLSNIEDMIGWEPYAKMKPSFVKDMRHLIDNQNNASAWLAFAGTSIRKAWEALPQDIRQDAIDAILEVVEKAMGDIDVDEIMDAVSSEISEAIPLIGAIINWVIQIVMIGVRAHNINKEQNELLTLDLLDIARKNTLFKYTDPNQWVLHQMNLEGFFDWKGIKPGLGGWLLKPCFGKNSEESWMLFNESHGQSDEGQCSGVRYDCGGTFFDLDKCEPKPSSGAGKECIRYLGISALYYPYWSPAYPAIPATVYSQDTKYDFNAELISRQVAMLTVPAVNLKIDGEKAQRFADRFKLNWDKSFKQFGKKLIKIDDQGYAIDTPTKERAIIDPKHDPGNAGSVSNMRKFYYDDDGLIQEYDNAAADLASWGIRAKGGKDSNGYIGITAAQYNCVIGNTLAFFSARSNFLRNGLAMKGMLQDYNVDTFWPDVREAIQYAADYGKMLPTATTVLQEPDKPARVKKSRYSEDEFTLVAKKIDASGESKSALPLLLIGGGLIALLALKGKGR